MIHAGGLSLTEGDVRGIGLSLGGSLGIGAARTTAATQTALSAIAQPPAKKKISRWSYAGLLFGLSWLVSGFSVPENGPFMIGLGAITLIASASYLYKWRKFNSESFPGLYAEWERKYMCERCGGVVLV